MKTDSVQQFVALRTALQQEKAQLEARLKKVCAALEGVGHVPVAVKAPAIDGRKKRGPRANNTMSLREAVTKVVAARPLEKPEIIKGVQALGYKFTAKDPMLSLNTLLYTPGNFKKHPGGKWGSLKK